MCGVNGFDGFDDIDSVDLFAGCGGASEGLARIGVHIAYAINHWAMAIRTHELRHPATVHHCAKIAEVDPRSLRPTTWMWLSPSCTKWSRAQGKRVAFGEDLFGGYPVGEESRATMWCALRWMETAADRGRPYEAVFLENVAEIVDWVLWPTFRHGVESLGYDMRILDLNSAFFGHPQGRNRVYILMTRRGMPVDLDFHPTAPCRHCDVDVAAVRVGLNPLRPHGIYGEAYRYQCPTCRRTVAPYAPGASTVLDLDDPGPEVPVAARGGPLCAATLERCADALIRWRDRGGTHPGYTPTTETVAGRAVLVAYHGNGGSRPVSAPSGPLTTRDRYGLLSWPEQDSPLDQCRYRMLSLAEQERLMGLDGLPWPVKVDQKRVGKKHKTTMVGNAVTPGVPAALGTRVAMGMGAVTRVAA